jgi:hypothetical protein
MKYRIELSRNPLFGLPQNKTLAELVAEIPADVTELDLSQNDLGNMNTELLAEAFAATPVSVTILRLFGNNLSAKQKADLVKLFKAIPASTKVDFGDTILHDLYDLDWLVKNHSKWLIDAINNNHHQGKLESLIVFFASGNTRKKLEQELLAISDLTLVLQGNNLDLSEHLPILNNCNFTEKLQKWIEFGSADKLVGKEVRTITDFIETLYEKNTNQAVKSARAT